MIAIVTSLGVLAALTAEPTVGYVHFQDEQSGSKSKDTSKKTKAKNHRGTFTISKETTYVTEPVDEDGYVDYVTALNQRLSEGIKPDLIAGIAAPSAAAPGAVGRTSVRYPLRLGAVSGHLFFPLPAGLRFNHTPPKRNFKTGASGFHPNATKVRKTL